MTKSQINRRSFLGSMAILSASAAFASVTKHLSSLAVVSDLQSQWLNFYTNNGGVTASSGQQNESLDLLPVQGHYYQKGKAIFFSQHNILAQPTWIYWNEGKTKPEDVAITFFESKNSCHKLFCLNRFELAALEALQVEGIEHNPISVLKERCKISYSGSRHFIAKTSVLKNQQVHIISALSAHQVLLKKNLNYNV